MRATLISMLGITAALISAGCASHENSPHQSPTARERIVGDWALTTLDGRDARSWTNDAHARAVPTLSIQPDGSVGGAAGVNRWFSTLDLDALDRGEFTLSAIGATKMAGPPDAMRLESEFFAALESAARFDHEALESDRLILLDGDGDALMEFEQAAPQR